MTTYTETQGHAPFDWRHALTNPRLFPHEVLCLRAREWVTCATGNQCADIPRDYNGAPIDDELRSLGRQFAQAVSACDWTDALETLSRIEARSRVLASLTV